MSEANIIRKNKDAFLHPCKTICCHGGMFLLALKEDTSNFSFEYNPYLYDAQTLYYKNSFIGKKTSVPNFADGAELLAKFLGFTNIEGLKDWAVRNPNLWGNRHGDKMFSADVAFMEDTVDQSNSCNGSVDTIINHWKKVADRIENLIEKTNKQIETNEVREND